MVSTTFEVICDNFVTIHYKGIRLERDYDSIRAKPVTLPENVYQQLSKAENIENRNKIQIFLY